MLNDRHYMDIVIDFDGTVVAHDYPRIGASIGAERVLKALIKRGHKLILFTMRDGNHLTRALDWFMDNGIGLYGVQTNPTQRSWTISNKAHGDLYIDDLGLGIPLRIDKSISERPFVDWTKVLELLESKGIL
jgi:hypothetical protein